MVYVDDYNAYFSGMLMCHMIAETETELEAMAKQLGLKRDWKQTGNCHSWPHYDISHSKKQMAVKFGAKEVTCKELVAIIREWKGKST